MRRSLLVKMVGIFLVSGFFVPGAEADSVLSFDPNRAQAVDQALDKMEGHVTPGTPLASPLKIFAANSHVKADMDTIDFSYQYYDSKFNESGFNQKGTLNGYQVQYAHRFSTDPNSVLNMFGLQAEWAGGKFKAPAGQGPSGIKDSTYDVRAIVGKDFYPSAQIRATPYAGYGYRYLKNKEAGLSYEFTDPSLSEPVTVLMYNRFSHYNYFPLGADMLYQPAPNYSIQGNLEYDYMFYGWQVNDLGINPGYNTVVLGQHGGYGLRASLRFNVYFSCVTAFAEGYWRYWNIPQSVSKTDPTDATLPPINETKNSTNEFGLRLGVEI